MFSPNDSYNFSFKTFFVLNVLFCFHFQNNEGEFADSLTKLVVNHLTNSTEYDEVDVLSFLSTRNTQMQNTKRIKKCANVLLQKCFLHFLVIKVLL